MSNEKEGITSGIVTMSRGIVLEPTMVMWRFVFDWYLTASVGR